MSARTLGANVVIGRILLIDIADSVLARTDRSTRENSTQLGAWAEAHTRGLLPCSTWRVGQCMKICRVEKGAIIRTLLSPSGFRRAADAFFLRNSKVTCVDTRRIEQHRDTIGQECLE